MLKLFYITNNPDIAKIAELAGVDRIFVDMEYIGKELRQPNMDTVKNHHTVDDVKAIKNVISKAELLVRINPINPSSQQEIDDVVNAGADVIMLPMWTTVQEVKAFASMVNGRAKTLLLLETDEASKIVDDVLCLNLIDKLVPHLHKLVGADTEAHNNADLSKVLLFVTAIAIHNLPEGIAAGVGFGLGDTTGAVIIAGGIALQNIPEGMVIIGPMLAAGVTPKKTLICAMITGLVEVFGTLIGYFAVSVATFILPFALSFAGAGLLMGVGGSLSAIHKFLKV